MFDLTSTFFLFWSHTGHRIVMNDYENRRWIHLNAAGSSPASDASHAATIRHFELEKEMGGYAAASLSPANPHESIARLLNCLPSEIAITDSAQQAWARAFYSLNFKVGDRILCFEEEYAGNAVAFLQAERRCPGLKIVVLPMRPDGIIDIDALEKALQYDSGSSETEQPRTLVALTHVQTNSSIVQPAAAVGRLCLQYNALYLLDSCQSIGQLPVDVKDIGCTFACGTGRKWLRGPRGTGFLYARLDALPTESRQQNLAKGQLKNWLVGEPPMLDHAAAQWHQTTEYTLLPDARRYEMWECSVALRHGLMVAVDECITIGPAVIFARACALAQHLRIGLSFITGVVLRDASPTFDETAGTRCAIVTFEAESTLHIPAAQIAKALTECCISCTISPSTHSFNELHRKRPPTVRISPHYFNTEADVDAVINVMREVVLIQESNG
jgi:selenocysteine lyase/cysteine desulfurase